MSYTGFYIDNKVDSIFFVVHVDHLEGKVVYETVDGPKTMPEHEFFHSEVDLGPSGDMIRGGEPPNMIKRYQKVKKWGNARMPGVIIPITV